MKIRKYRSKDPLQYEYSISHLTQKEFRFLASIMANLRFDVPCVKKVGRLSADYDCYQSIVPAYCSDIVSDVRSFFGPHGFVGFDNLTPQTEIKFDIDDVL